MIFPAPDMTKPREPDGPSFGVRKDAWMGRKKMLPAPSAAGLLLVDSSLRPVWFNLAAVQILSYPEKPGSRSRLDLFLGGKIQSNLVSEQPSLQSPFVTELKSGRRRYLCRIFRLAVPTKSSSSADVAILLERRSLVLIALGQVCEQFKLTRREREALECLLEGLTSKEIADRMMIAPNTVKAFLRLIMIKMGVSTRSAIFAKIVTTMP